jgi:hypothetical protein
MMEFCPEPSSSFSKKRNNPDFSPEAISEEKLEVFIFSHLRSEAKLF